MKNCTAEQWADYLSDTRVYQVEYIYGAPCRVCVKGVIMNNEDTQKLLVDCACGTYAWARLVKNYPLFIQGARGTAYIALEDWLINNSDIMDGETLATVFDPDNAAYCENLEYLTIQTFNLYVHSDEGEYWRIEQNEGDIWAINPRAVWSDSEEGYIFEEVK